MNLENEKMKLKILANLIVKTIQTHVTNSGVSHKVLTDISVCVRVFVLSF